MLALKRKIFFANLAGMAAGLLVGILVHAGVFPPVNGVWLLVAVTLVWGGSVIRMAANH